MKRLEQLHAEHPEYWGTEHRKPITLSTLETMSRDDSDLRFILFMPERLFGNCLSHQINGKQKEDSDNNETGNCSDNSNDVSEDCDGDGATAVYNDDDDDSTDSSEEESIADDDAEEACMLVGVINILLIY